MHGMGQGKQGAKQQVLWHKEVNHAERHSKQSSRVPGATNHQNLVLRSPDCGEMISNKHFGSEIQQQLLQSNSQIDHNNQNILLSPQKLNQLTPLMQQSSEKHIPNINQEYDGRDHLYDDGLANQVDYMYINNNDEENIDSNAQMDCSIDIFQNQDSIQQLHTAAQHPVFQNQKQAVRNTVGGGRPVPQHLRDGAAGAYHPALFSKDLMIKCKQQQIASYLKQDSSPYLKSLIQSKIIDSSEPSPNVSPIMKAKSPTSSANTSLLIHPLMIQVSDTETNYAQQYIKNNYGYDIQEIYQIEQDMKNSKSQRKKNDLETLDVITELDPLSTVRNPLFEDKASPEIQLHQIQTEQNSSQNAQRISGPGVGQMSPQSFHAVSPLQGKLNKSSSLVDSAAEDQVIRAQIYQDKIPKSNNISNQPQTTRQSYLLNPEQNMQSYRQNESKQADYFRYGSPNVQNMNNPQQLGPPQHTRQKEVQEVDTTRLNEQRIHEEENQIKEEEQLNNNSVQFTENERSEINYEEIRVTDSFSIVGNVEATHNSNISGIHQMSSRNTINHQGSRFMVEIQSVDSEAKNLEAHGRLKNSSEMSIASSQQKDINDLEIANNLVVNIKGGVTSPKNMYFNSRDPVQSQNQKEFQKQHDQAFLTKQSPVEITAPTLELNKLQLQSSSSLIGSTSDQNQAKSKFKTIANTPMQCSNNTSPKNGLPLMVTPKTIKQTAVDKSVNMHAEQYSVGQQHDHIIYEISHNTSKISSSEEVAFTGSGAGGEKRTAADAEKLKVNNPNNLALPNQVIISSRQQHRSQTNYQQQNHSRLLEQQIHTSGEQCLLRYDTQEDLQTKLHNNQEGDGVNGLSYNPQGLGNVKNARQLAVMFSPSCQIHNKSTHPGANLYGQEQLAGGYQPSEVESSVVQFNALSFNNLGIQFQTSNPKSRAISGEKFNENNYSVRQSLLADKIEQIRSGQSTIEQEVFFQNQLSLMEAAHKEQLYQQQQQYYTQSQMIAKDEDLQKSLMEHNLNKQYQSIEDKQNELQHQNSLQMSPSQDMSSLNVDEKTPQLSPNSTNSNYFSKNRSQIVNKSFSKKSPALNKLQNSQSKANNSKTQKTHLQKSQNNIQKGKLNTSIGKAVKDQGQNNTQKLAQSKSNRSIQLPTSSQISLKKPMVQSDQFNISGKSLGRTAISKTKKLSPSALSQVKYRMKSHEKQFKGLDTGLLGNDMHLNCSMTMTVGGKDAANRVNMSPLHRFGDPAQNNDCDDDRYIPTGEPELTQFQSNVSSLIQLPNKTGQTAKLSEKNTVPRSLSSVQNKHANSRLKAILQSNYIDQQAQLTQRESKSHRRNNNPLSMDVNSMHRQTHQVVLDHSNHIKPLKKEEFLRFIESPTPPQSTFFINSTSNTPIRDPGALASGYNDTGAKSLNQHSQNQNCKISDLLGRTMDHETKEKTLQQIILESESNFDQMQSQQQHISGDHNASKSAEISFLSGKFIEKTQIQHMHPEKRGQAASFKKDRPCQDSIRGQNVSKNSLITHSPQSFQSPPITNEGKSIRYSLISLFKGTDKNTQLQNGSRGGISVLDQGKGLLQPDTASQCVHPLLVNQLSLKNAQNQARGADDTLQPQSHQLQAQYLPKTNRSQAKSQEMVSEKHVVGAEQKSAQNTIKQVSSTKQIGTLKQKEQIQEGSASSFFKQLSNFKKNFLEFSTPSKSQDHKKNTIQKDTLHVNDLSKTVILDQSSNTVKLHNYNNSKSAPKNNRIVKELVADKVDLGSVNYRVDSQMKKYLNQTHSNLNSAHKLNIQLDGNNTQQFTPAKPLEFQRDQTQEDHSNALKIPLSESIKSIQHKASSMINMRSNRSSIHKQKKSGNGYIQSKFGAILNNLTINEPDNNSEKISNELKFNCKLEMVSATSTPNQQKSLKQIGGTLSESNTEKLSLSSPTHHTHHNTNHQPQKQQQLQFHASSPQHQDNLNFYLNLSKKNDSKMKQIIEQSSRSRHTQFGSQNYQHNMHINNSYILDSSLKIYSDTGTLMRTPYQLQETQELHDNQDANNRENGTDKIVNLVTMDSQIQQHESSSKDLSSQQHGASLYNRSGPEQLNIPAQHVSFFQNTTINFKYNNQNNNTVIETTKQPEDLQTPKWKQVPLVPSMPPITTTSHSAAAAASHPKGLQNTSLTNPAFPNTSVSSFISPAPAASTPKPTSAKPKSQHQQSASGSAASKLSQSKAFNSKFASLPGQSTGKKILSVQSAAGKNRNQSKNLASKVNNRKQN